jgi:hypothetical protein
LNTSADAAMPDVSLKTIAAALRLDEAGWERPVP